jgi:HSP20 family protein
MLTLWTDPFRKLDTFQNQMTRLLQQEGIALVPSPRGLREEGVAAAAWVPPVDIHETPDSLVFSVEVPGFKESDLNLKVENGALVLEGERQFESRSDEENYHRVERAYGKFFRSFALPPNISPDQVNANLENGVLRIELSKKEETKPKTIPIGARGKIPSALEAGAARESVKENKESRHIATSKKG